MSEKVILEVKILKHFQIGRNKFLKAVDGVSLQIREGETLGLVGESGRQSTLGRTIIKIYEPLRSDYLQDTDITQPVTRQNRHVLQKMQMIFQDPYTSLNPHYLEISSPRLGYQKKYKGKKKKGEDQSFWNWC